MSTGSAFKLSLHLCNVSNLRFLLVFQLRTCKVGFSGLSRNGPLVVLVGKKAIYLRTGDFSVFQCCVITVINIVGHFSPCKAFQRVIGCLPFLSQAY